MKRLKSSMGILPMSIMGVPPVSLLLPLLLPLLLSRKNEKKQTTGKMPVRLMGETPMLRPVDDC